MNESQQRRVKVYILTFSLTIVLVLVSLAYISAYDQQANTELSSPYRRLSRNFINSQHKLDKLNVLLQNPNANDFTFLFWTTSDVPLLVDIVHDKWVDQNITVTSKGVRFHVVSGGGRYYVYQSLNYSYANFKTDKNLTQATNPNNNIRQYFDLYFDQFLFFDFKIDASHSYQSSVMKDSLKTAGLYTLLLLLIFLWIFTRSNRLMDLKRRFPKQLLQNQSEFDMAYPQSTYIKYHPDLDKEIPDIKNNAVYIGLGFILITLNLLIFGHVQIYEDLYLLHLIFLIYLTYIFAKLLYFANSPNIILPCLSLIFTSVFFIVYKYEASMGLFSLTLRAFLLMYSSIWFVFCGLIFLSTRKILGEIEGATISHFDLFGRQITLDEFYTILFFTQLLGFGIWFIFISS